MAIVNGDLNGNILVGTALDDTLSGLGGDDVLASGLGNDSLNGGSGDDVLAGGDGDDHLDGGNGFDLMIGGNGDDTYVVDSVADVIVETSATGGSDLVLSSVSHTLGANFESLLLLGNRNLNGQGNAQSNVLAGNLGNNRLSGLNGNDLFLASSGNDILDGGLGTDIADYSALATRVTLLTTGIVEKGLTTSDTLYDVEIVIGAEGQNNLINAATTFGSPLSVSVDLSQQSLRVSGVSQGADQALTVRNFVDVVGTSQADFIAGDSADNTLQGEAGNDVLSGAAGSDTLLGGTGHDSLSGGMGNDFLFGGSGNDTVMGGAGVDRLVGYNFTPGGEVDTLIGGTGVDIFVLGDNTNGRYYLEPLLANNTDDSYAIIADWDFTTDLIQLQDTFNYTFEFRTGIGIGTTALDTFIFSDNNIVGIIQDSTNFNFSRDVVLV